MTRIINNTNPATPTTLNVSSSTDNVLIEAASSALEGLEEGLTDWLADWELRALE